MITLAGGVVLILLIGSCIIGYIGAVWGERITAHVIATTRRCHHCGRVGRHGFTKDGRHGWICTYGPPCAKRYMSRKVNDNE